MGLGAWADQQTLVTLTRLALDEQPWEGFLVGCSAELVVLHVVSDRYDLDGHRVFRRRDLAVVERTFDRRDLLLRALDLKGERPVVPDGLDLRTIPELIVSVLEEEPVVVMEREEADPEVCEIGRPFPAGPGRYRLIALDPNARWWLDDRVYAYDDVTQVSFGGGYARTLAALAGPPPVWDVLDGQEGTPA